MSVQKEDTMTSVENLLPALGNMVLGNGRPRPPETDPTMGWDERDTFKLSLRVAAYGDWSRMGADTATEASGRATPLEYDRPFRQDFVQALDARSPAPRKAVEGNVAYETLQDEKLVNKTVDELAGMTPAQRNNYMEAVRRWRRTASGDEEKGEFEGRGQTADMLLIATVYGVKLPSDRLHIADELQIKVESALQNEFKSGTPRNEKWEGFTRIDRKSNCCPSRACTVLIWYTCYNKQMQNLVHGGSILKTLAATKNTIPGSTTSHLRDGLKGLANAAFGKPPAKLSIPEPREEISAGAERRVDNYSRTDKKWSTGALTAVERQELVPPPDAQYWTIDQLFKCTFTRVNKDGVLAPPKGKRKAGPAAGRGNGAAGPSGPPLVL